MSDDVKDPNVTWNSDQGILGLVEFQPLMPMTAQIGVTVAKDPVKREALKKVFLSVLRSTAEVQQAARICQIPQSLAYVWRNDDPEFAYRWDNIFKSEMLPHLEAEAVRRAMNGSDLMLMFMLKALNREKYDDKVAEKSSRQPSITIQMVDVGNVLIGKADSHGGVNPPPVKYLDGEVLDGTSTSLTLDQQVSENTIANSNELVTGATKASDE